MKHWHHIIPKHMGGSDDPSNLVQLTIEEHAEAHHKLFLYHNRWEDEVAWKALSGQIKYEEATLIAIKKANIGKTPWNKGKKGLQIHSEEWKKEHSRKMKLNNPSSRLDVKLKVKEYWTEENKQIHSQKISKSTKGKKKNTTINMKKPKPLLVCPNCNKEGHGHSNMYRWHFDNCKEKLNVK